MPLKIYNHKATFRTKLYPIFRLMPPFDMVCIGTFWWGSYKEGSQQI